VNLRLRGLLAWSERSLVHIVFRAQNDAAIGQEAERQRFLGGWPAGVQKNSGIILALVPCNRGEAGAQCDSHQYAPKDRPKEPTDRGAGCWPSFDGG
jgi:hypothetical protein